MKGKKEDVVYYREREKEGKERGGGRQRGWVERREREGDDHYY